VFRALVAAAEPAMALVEAVDLNKKGSGFVVSPTGHIVTNNHVVTALAFQNGVVTVTYSQDIQVRLGGVTYPATVVTDTNTMPPFVYDYAILKIQPPGITPHLELAEINDVRRGDSVLCLGFPLDFSDLIATSGIVSAVLLRPSHRSTLFQIRTIVSDALIQFGHSGGPMLHLRSEKVVGINTLSHELVDVLAQRLWQWRGTAQASQLPILQDLIEFTLKYTYVGLNHAVSVEHVHEAPEWPI
jgi:S1-C subfamily serine protease